MAVNLRNKLRHDNFVVSHPKQYPVGYELDLLQIYEKAESIGGTWRVSH